MGRTKSTTKTQTNQPTKKQLKSKSVKTKSTNKSISKHAKKTIQVKPLTADAGKLTKDMEYALHPDDYAIVMSINIAKTGLVPSMKSTHLTSFVFKHKKSKK